MKITAVLSSAALVASLYVQSASAAKAAISTERVLELRHLLADAGAHTRNLLQMRESLDSADRQSEHEIVTFLFEVNDAVNGLLTLAYLYQRMDCAADKESVREELPTSLKYASAALDESIRAINEELAVLTSRGAMSETQRIRDGLQMIRSELDKYSY